MSSTVFFSLTPINIPTHKANAELVLLKLACYQALKSGWSVAYEDSATLSPSQDESQYVVDIGAEEILLSTTYRNLHVAIDEYFRLLVRTDGFDMGDVSLCKDPAGLGARVTWQALRRLKIPITTLLQNDQLDRALSSIVNS